MKKTNTPVSDIIDYLAKKIYIFEYVDPEKGKPKVKPENKTAWSTASDPTIKTGSDKGETEYKEPVAL